MTLLNYYIIIAEVMLAAHHFESNVRQFCCSERQQV